MVTPRSVAVIAVFVSLVAGAPTASARDTESDNIGSLRRAADKARAELESATKKWESRKKDLARSQAKLKATLKDLGAADVELNRIRGPLATLANAAYQEPAAGSMVIFGEGSPDDALRSAADTNHLADSQNALVEQAARLRRQHDQLAASAQELESRNAVEQAGLQQQIDGIKRRSAQLTQQLTLALDRIRADRDRRLEIGCSAGLVADARKYPNGLIPSRYLCKLPQKGALLRADAARSFLKLNAAYKKRFGRDMCIRDSYRSLYAQQQVYAQRPGFAAVPGRSNHGLGTALDFCGGVQNQGSVQFNWLRANSLRFGWFHPSWAYSSPFEPWHWEYKAGR
ncbi:MAG TPA: D-alanyl-D-alanine carboxypeptidase family protein [Streptosporangiaceae bacterium]|nr:D-alanyl-D-alanine carboxypeptidase family protein [Streptosporangiaceae bacterium]